MYTTKHVNGMECRLVCDERAVAAPKVTLLLSSSSKCQAQPLEGKLATDQHRDALRFLGTGHMLLDIKMSCVGGQCCLQQMG